MRDIRIPSRYCISIFSSNSRCQGCIESQSTMVLRLLRTLYAVHWSSSWKPKLSANSRRKRRLIFSKPHLTNASLSPVSSCVLECNSIMGRDISLFFFAASWWQERSICSCLRWPLARSCTKCSRRVSEYRCMHRNHRVGASSIYAPYIPIALDTSIEFGASSGTDGSLSTRVLWRKGFNPDPCQVFRIKAGFFSLPQVGFRRLTARNKHVPYTAAAAAHRVLCRQK